MLYSIRFDSLGGYFLVALAEVVVIVVYDLRNIIFH